ncbi:pantothenate kinase 1 [Pelomyxa schiedti]|nr:pantothenate kinase 1 [Pelomyxa schiedti]
MATFYFAAGTTYRLILHIRHDQWMLDYAESTLPPSNTPMKDRWKLSLGEAVLLARRRWVELPAAIVTFMWPLSWVHDPMRRLREAFVVMMSLAHCVSFVINSPVLGALLTILFLIRRSPGFALRAALLMWRTSSCAAAHVVWCATRVCTSTRRSLRLLLRLIARQSTHYAATAARHAFFVFHSLFFAFVVLIPGWICGVILLLTVRVHFSADTETVATTAAIATTASTGTAVTFTGATRSELNRHYGCTTVNTTPAVSSVPHQVRRRMITTTMPPSPPPVPVPAVHGGSPPRSRSAAPAPAPAPAAPRRQQQRYQIPLLFFSEEISQVASTFQTKRNLKSTTPAAAAAAVAHAQQSRSPLRTPPPATTTAANPPTNPPPPPQPRSPPASVGPSRVMIVRGSSTTPSLSPVPAITTTTTNSLMLPPSTTSISTPVLTPKAATTPSISPSRTAPATVVIASNNSNNQVPFIRRSPPKARTPQDHPTATPIGDGGLPPRGGGASSRQFVLTPFRASSIYPNGDKPNPIPINKVPAPPPPRAPASDNNNEKVPFIRRSPPKPRTPQDHPTLLPTTTTPTAAAPRGGGASSRQFVLTPFRASSIYPNGDDKLNSNLIPIPINKVYWRPPNPPTLPDYINKEPYDSANNFFLRPDPTLSVSMKPRGNLKFIKFPVTHADQFIQFLVATKLHQQYGNYTEVFATGGGAYKYAQLVQDSVNLRLVQQDEMKCLVKGLNFLLAQSDNEVFEYVNLGATSEKRFITKFTQLNYILVNVGSGVSILEINGENFQRISGSALGGGTFWGLTKLMTHYSSFADVVATCQRGAGDNRNVDLLVSDIYGTTDKSSSLGLSPTLKASSLGKVQRSTHPTSEYRDEDILKSLLYMISDNIAQIGLLNAKLHGLKTVVFVGGFIMDNPAVWRSITWAVNYWSQGEMTALFLRHDGYLGALGALLLATH